jgi:HSP20 family protein
MNPRILRNHAAKKPTTIMTNLEKEFDKTFATIDRAEKVFTRADDLGSCKLLEEKTKFVVKVDLPRIKKDDIKIEVHGSQLRIVVKHNENNSAKHGSSSDKKTSRSYLQRSFTLPSIVNGKSMSSKFEKGILTISLPKSSFIRTKKQVAKH